MEELKAYVDDILEGFEFNTRAQKIKALSDLKTYVMNLCREELKKEIEDVLVGWLKKQPKRIETISWRQFVNYYNDQDWNRAGVELDSRLISINGRCGEDSDDDDLNEIYDKLYGTNHVLLDKEEEELKKKADKIYKEKYFKPQSEFASLLAEFDEDILEMVFGQSSKVTVTRTGIERTFHEGY